MEQIRDELPKKAWQYLNLLKTQRGTLHHLEKNGSNLSFLDQRADAISSLISSAYELYVEYKSSHSLITLYYMCFRLVQAQIVSKSVEIYSLKQLQNSSRNGHGIKMTLNDGKHFPDGIRFIYLANGMLYDWLKLNSWSDSVVNLQGRTKISDLLFKTPTKDLKKYNIFTLSDLLRRMPDIKLYRYDLNIGIPYYYLTGQDQAFSYDPGADINVTSPDWEDYSLLAIKKSVSEVNRPKAAYNEYMSQYNLLKFSPQPEKVFHYKARISIPLHNHYVRKLSSISDMLTLFFTTLYILSILIRYYPEEWNRMTVGQNSLLPFIDTFLELCEVGISTWVCYGIYNKEPFY